MPWALALAAFLVRLAGIGWGLPNEDRWFSYHPDEPVNLLYARQISIGKGDFDPGFYNYGTLYLTVASLADSVVRGYSPEPQSPEAQAALDARSTLAGRFVSALAGAIAVLLVFALLRRWIDDLSSTLGAAVIAIAPAHVVHSRFLTVDVFATLWIAASAYAATRLLPDAGGSAPSTDRERWKWSLLAGTFAGLAAGTKYNGILALAVLGIVLAWERAPRALVRGLTATLASCAAFLVSTPGALLNAEKFRVDVAYELTHARSGHGLVFEGMPPSWVLHLWNLAIGVGALVLAVSAVGLFLGIRRKHPGVLAVAGFTLLFYLVLSRAEVAFARYTFPLYLGIASGMGWFVWECREWGPRGRFLIAAAILFLGGLPLGDGLMSTGRLTAAMMGPDARDMVALELHNQAVSGQTMVGVVADPWFYTPPYYPLAVAPRFVPEPIRRAALEETAGKPVRVLQYRPEIGEKLDWDPRLLTELKPQYVTYSSFEEGDLRRLSRQSGHREEIQVQVDRFNEFQKELRDSYELFSIAAQGPPLAHDLEYARPVVWVWKRKGP